MLTRLVTGCSQLAFSLLLFIGIPCQAFDGVYNGQKVHLIALGELGVSKVPNEDSARVKQYVEETFQNDEEYSSDGWCSGFVSWVLKQAGYQYSPENTDYGWMYYLVRVSEPKIGDIVLMEGHIAFFDGYATQPTGEKYVRLLGGNQDYQVCIMAVPSTYIYYYAEAIPATEGWIPKKHIPGGGVDHINTLDDHLHFTAPNVRRTSGGHPL